MRNLLHRHHDGIDVFVDWDANDNTCWLHVCDNKLGVEFEVKVDNSNVLHAFEHPFLYEPRKVAA